MTRLTRCFEKLRSQKRVALIPFITAGDPSPNLIVPLMHTLVNFGADIIELGVPFSDPMADGPIIQRANERALAAGTHLPIILENIALFRQQNSTTPVVLMGYLNPIEIMGYETFLTAAAQAGVDGLLTVDLPPEEAHEMLESLKKHAIDPIFLLSPTTTVERIKCIAAQARGYLYYISLKGVTGSADLDIQAVADKLNLIRQCTNLPIGVGFGIKNAQTAAQVARFSDGVVVGSALVSLIESTPPENLLQEVGNFLKGLRQAMDQF